MTMIQVVNGVNERMLRCQFMQYNGLYGFSTLGQCDIRAQIQQCKFTLTKHFNHQYVHKYNIHLVPCHQ